MGDRAAIPPLPFLLLGVLSLLLALFAGLGRLPWIPGVVGRLALLHGPLMVCGFLGTVIAVERATSLGVVWAWLAPLGTGLGTLLMLAVLQLPPELPFSTLQAGASLFTLGSIGLMAIFLQIVRTQPRLFNVIMALGTVCFFGGNVVLMAGQPVARAVPWLAAFLVLTIAGERLELNRLMAPRPGARRIFLAAIGLLMLGVLLSLWSLKTADLAFGGALLVLALWLLSNDIARRTIHTQGLTRFVATGLLSGYVWLAVAGVLFLFFPGRMGGMQRDATLHSLFIGFVIAMIFGHAPIVVPALFGIEVRFGKRFYVPLTLLHLSLLLRVVSDLAGWAAGRRWGGLANIVVVLLYLLVLLSTLRRQERSFD